MSSNNPNHPLSPTLKTPPLHLEEINEITDEEKELQKALEREFDELLKKQSTKSKPIAIPNKKKNTTKKEEKSQSLPKSKNKKSVEETSNSPKSLPTGQILLTIPIDLNKEGDSDDDEEEDPDFNPDEEESFWWNEEEKSYWDTLTENEQNDLKRHEKEVENYRKLDVPGRFHILQAKMSLASKAMILRKWEQLEQMEPTDNEFFKLNRWMDGIMRIPFGRSIPFPVRREDPPQMVHQFLNLVARSLHQSVYGHEHAKERLLQFVAQSISNPNSQGHCIALCGPPGIGKTSLIKQGVASALGRPFAFLALGGASDASYLEGHHYTYEGSQWGRVADILISSKCMNPVIFFDELDKISETKQGDEIVGVLTHLTDPSQNTSIQDKYFANIDLDLSKALFIFSLNDETKINPILKDRMYMIHLEGFKAPEKKKIAQQYLWPELLENTGFQKEDVSLSEETWDWLIQNKEKDDPGVRGLRRLLESLLLQLNVIRWYPDALEHGSISAAAIVGSLDENGIPKKKILEPPATEINFPFEITPAWIEYFLKKEEKENEIPIGVRMMYC